MISTSSKWLASVLAAGLLAACGGGSSPGTSASAPTPTAAALAVQVTPEMAAATPVVDQPADSDRASREAASATNRVYIVQIDGQPATAYDGGIQGLQATRPRKGQKIDPDSPAVTNYMAYLASRHDAALRGVGAAKKLYSYGYVFNGFAAELSDAQAQQLALSKGVLAVSKDEVRAMDTASTATFLGLAGDNGFWARTGAKGENVIIGMVDSGIWPESASFSDRTGTNGNATQDGKLDYLQIPGWHGKCVPGDQFDASHCNQKLIGARYYNAGWGGNAAISANWPGAEYNSPRDWGGHGTHTASTAGGNADVTVTGPAAAFGKVTGMAPRARIAAYKVCWSTEAFKGGCFNSDSVAAIEQAVADGVDVINFSISGSTASFRDPVEIAFMYAADAGVFVAASAGNSGPATGTVAHPSPWLTTVAAGTHNRTAVGSAIVAGTTYNGASLAAAAAGPATLVDAATAGLPTASATAAALCFSSTWQAGAGLDPAKVGGKIVLCDRGTNDRVDKSKAVAEAGGIGMILVNTSVNSLNADYHSVPTVHVAVDYRPALKAAASAGAQATVNKSWLDFNTAAPFTASFSSRGPSVASGGVLLKPDVIAPGQSILAAVAPPGNHGRSFDLYDGTSMSSPHVAGIAALFKELNPSWSPMAIKSALMTTAYDVLDGPNTNPAVIFRQGAGHVKPLAAMDPGLVFDAGFKDWLGFLCGTQLPTSFCTAAGVPVVAPSNMNVASIALGALPGIQTVTRRVTNVGKSTTTYTGSYTGLAGFGVAMSPASFSIGPGETKAFDITFTRTTAALNTYAGGQFTLTGADGHKVRVPVVARPVPLAAPAEVTGSYKVTFGYDGPFTAAPIGLVPAAKATGTVATDGHVDFPIVVPAGTALARFSLFDANVSAASDLDLEIYQGTTLVASSGGPTAAEQAQLPAALAAAGGTFTVRVIGYATPAGGVTFDLFSWSLGATNANNLAVAAPTSAVTGTTGTVTLTPDASLPAGKYLGAVRHGGSSAALPSTIVRIDR